MANHGTLRRMLAIIALLMILIVIGLSAFVLLRMKTIVTGSLDPATRFYVPNPNLDALRQVAELTSQERKADAARISAIINTPTAVWVKSVVPKGAEQEVRLITEKAAQEGTVPVLVLYNIPFRDCAQYSAGGATSVAAYKAWIDGVAKGIGDRTAIVAVEPDSLGIIPWYTNISGQLEWCQSTEAPKSTAATERFEMLRYAVDTLKVLPKTKVYLDGTHDGWLSVGDISDRLIKAGVTKADGFFVNASNFRWSDHLVKYGAWVAQCIYLDQHSEFKRSSCGSQYAPANPADFNTWGLTDAVYDKAFKDTDLDRNWKAMPHFLIDTSRNGQGPWIPPAGKYPDPQDWCNPPHRGAGLRPSANTGSPLADAYVWIKVPGESDGQCSRSLGPTGTVDPEWGIVDPASGRWFRAQALELANLAVPPLVSGTATPKLTSTADEYAQADHYAQAYEHP